jgi:hypothetical protein
MCASLLRQYRIRKVYYGASNDRFGGTGGVLSIHEKEAGVGEGYEVSGGWLRERAILLLRRFYVQENGKGEFLLFFTLWFGRLEERGEVRLIVSVRGRKEMKGWGWGGVDEGDEWQRDCDYRLRTVTDLL